MGEKTEWTDKWGAKWVDEDADDSVSSVDNRKIKSITVIQYVAAGTAKCNFQTYYPEGSKLLRDAAINKLKEEMRVCRATARKGRRLAPAERLMVKKQKDEDA